MVLIRSSARPDSGTPVFEVLEMTDGSGAGLTGATAYTVVRYT
ncbi:hypothetical protein ACWIG5_11400 [Streptomyces lydicus]